MSATIYLLCALTALACCVLLFRGYRRTRVRLLFWSALCFGCLTVENLLLFADRVVFPDLPLAIWRLPPALLGVAMLLYGLIWKKE